MVHENVTILVKLKIYFFVSNNFFKNGGKNRLGVKPVNTWGLNGITSEINVDY